MIISEKMYKINTNLTIFVVKLMSCGHVSQWLKDGFTFGQHVVVKCY